ncbi:MAG: ribbon-helix-helix protein, CopG family [Thermoleophilaceae bacterium]|jgi:predicted transcriptional regulator
MRTTVELSDPLYRRLKAAAVDRGVRGFSPIVEEAVAEYLDAEGERRDIVRAIEDAEGAWTEADVAEWEDARRRAWSGWKTDRS